MYTSIAFEGIDMCGKETQARLLSASLTNSEYHTQKFSFPTYGTPQSKMEELYLQGKFGDDLDIMTIASFFAMDRAITIHEQLNEYSDFIIFDRYVGSNMIYQSALSCLRDQRDYLTDKEFDLMKRISSFEYDIFQIPKIDFTFFLYMSEECHKKIMRETVGESGGRDINEKNVDLLTIVRKISPTIAELNNWIVIKCDVNGELISPERISTMIQSYLRNIGKINI